LIAPLLQTFLTASLHSQPLSSLPVHLCFLAILQKCRVLQNLSLLWLSTLWKMACCFWLFKWGLSLALQVSSYLR
jgi:hypothetical protein